MPSPDTPASAKVREQLIRALELDLVGPTPGLLAQLEAEGQVDEVAELRDEVLDRPPNRWYQSGFLIPSETSLGASAGAASGGRPGRPPKMLQAGETVYSRVEPTGFGG